MVAYNAIGASSRPALGYAYIQGKTAPPPVPDIFSIEITANGSRRFNFGLTDAPLDLDGFEIRYNTGAAAIAWESQTAMHTQRLKTAPYETMGFLSGQYSFTVRAIDTSGNYSAGRNLTTTFSVPANSVILATEDAREGSWLG